MPSRPQPTSRSAPASRRPAGAIVLASLLLALGAGAPPASAGLGAERPPESAAPVSARAAAPSYTTLRRLGIRVSGARLKNRTLRVTVRARRRAALRFAIVRGKRQHGSAKLRVRAGRSRLRLLLNRASAGSGLRLRITARVGETRGRNRVAVAIVPLVASPVRRPGAGTAPGSGTGTGTGTAPGTGSGTASAPGTGTGTGTGTSSGSGGNTTGGDPATPAGDGGQAPGGSTPPPPPPPPAPNQVPGGLSLDDPALAEDLPVGTAVGAVSAVDADGDPLSFALVAGDGDTDNAAFVLDGATLRIASPLDHETRPAPTVRIAARDGRGGSTERSFTLTVLDVNEPPGPPTLAPASVAEAQAVGTTVGTLAAADPDLGDTAVFELVAGPGATDNAAFAIVGGELRTAAVLDREAKATRSVRVRVTDADGSTTEAALLVTVLDVPEAPTSLTLVPATVAENLPANAGAGLLGTTDPDTGETHTFTLVPGPGSTDNALFWVDGGVLRTATPLDHEASPTRSVRLRVDDGRGGWFEQAFTVTVTDVVEAPTDLILSSTVVIENAPVGTVVGTLSGIDPEPGDTLTFSLAAGTGDTDNAAFAVAGDELRTAVSLDHEATPTRSVRLRVTDSRGATREEQFTIAVTNTIDAPAGPDLSGDGVPENTAAGATVGTLSATDTDPGDSQSYALVAGMGDTDNAAFTIVGTSLRTAAVLDHEAAATRSVRVRVTDQDGLFSERAFTITVTDANDAPVADDETFTGAMRAVGNTRLVSDDPTDGPPAATGPRKVVTGDLLAGDTDEDTGATLSIVPGTRATDDGGTVTVEADGDFVYTPLTGTSCTDTTDGFDYTVTDGNSTLPPGTPATDTAHVTLTLADCAWYVDAGAAAGGDGSSAAPFTTLAPLRGAGDVDAATHVLLVAPGTYTGGLTLETGQRLLAARHGYAVPDGAGGTATLQAGGAAATRIDGGLVLAQDTTVQGVDLGAATGAALSAGAPVGTTAVGTETAGTIDNPTGGAISLPGGTVAMAFGAVTSGGGTNGIALTDVAGTVTAGGGALSGASGAAVSLSGGSVAFTYAGTVTATTGPAVTIAGQTAGTKDFDGLVTGGTGGGVTLTSNTGATVRFDGGLALATGAQPAFTATGGGTVAVTDPAGATANTLQTTTGTALHVAGTQIHADDLTFQRIASTGAANGILLNGTGTAGGLTVTGTGTAGSGGTISGSTGGGVVLTDVGGGALHRMVVGNGADDGVRATNVAGLEVADSTVSANGNAAGERGLDLTAVTGTLALTNTSVSGSADDNVAITTDAGALQATVTGGTYGPTDPTTGGDGIRLTGTGSGTQSLTVTGATFTDNRGDHLQVTTDTTTSVAQTVLVDTVTMTSSSASVVGGGITLDPGGSATLAATVDAVNVQGAVDSAIVVDAQGTAASPQPVVIDATIRGVTIGTAATLDSGARTGPGIVVSSQGGSDVDALIENSSVRQYGDFAGVLLQQTDGPAVLDATVRGTTVANPGTTGRDGVYLQSGGSGGPETGTNCFDVGGESVLAWRNTLQGAGQVALSGYDVVLLKRAQTSVRLPGYTGGATDTAAAGAYLAGRNLGTPTARVDLGGGAGTLQGGPACTLP